MAQKSVEADQFIQRILALPPGPGVSLDDALAPSINTEYALRQLWANDREHERLKNPYVGLVDLFAAPQELRTTRARVVEDEEDLRALHVILLMTLTGVLKVLAPLLPTWKVSKRAIRKHYHNKAYPTSDVDLFLWGMNAEEAEKKIIQVYEGVRGSIPWDVTCVRTKHTISIHCKRHSPHICMLSDHC